MMSYMEIVEMTRSQMILDPTSLMVVLVMTIWHHDRYQETILLEEEMEQII